MKKINKQVAKSKISCFLEINKVVLFFHCNNNVCLNKNDNFLNLKDQSKFYFNKNGKRSDLLVKNTRDSHSFTFPRKETQTRENRIIRMNGASFDDLLDQNINQDKRVLISENAFKSMMVKNRLARKAFLELKQERDQLSVTRNSATQISSRNFLFESSPNPNPKLKPSRTALKPFCQGDNIDFKKRECLTALLFQGPTLLLGCSDIKLLEKGIDACAKYKGVILLGAFYDKSIINHLQIKKLIAVSNNDKGYVRLISSMKNTFLRPLSLIRDLLSMQCLLIQQDKLIKLLKARKQQILVTKL